MTKKSIIKTVILFIILFLSITILLGNVNIKIARANYDYSSSEIVMEVNSKRVLHQKNQNDKRFMASTTKILTAIVIIENCNLNDKITVKKDTTNIEGSSIYLEEGEVISVRELLYGLMLRSGNDCACTLAKHCSNSIEDFANLMNATARKIGAKNSNFTNPHGLHDDNHYTTAYDLALITSYAMQNSVFREIVGTKNVTISNTNHDYKRYLKNKNKLLFSFDGATGVKTGYTKKAGRCLVSSAKRENIEVVCVVLNCGPMFERSKELLETTLTNYKNVKLIDSKNIVGYAKSSISSEEIPLYLKNDVIVPLTEKEKELVRIEYDYPQILSNTAKKDEVAGFIKIYCENNLIFKQKIYIMISE